jgi:hypothetical protein
LLYTHIIEYYSVKKKKKIMLFAGKWMKLEIIILSKISQAQNAKHQPGTSGSNCNPSYSGGPQFKASSGK